jgi:hypothetical protein
MPKLLCFLTSLFAVLLSVEPGGAVLPWATGTTIAAIALIERFRCIPSERVTALARTDFPTRKARRKCSRRAPTLVSLVQG